jgi:hypothetical protein
MMTAEQAPGAQFEVSIDGKLYSHREAIGSIAAETSSAGSRIATLW